ncbi:MAG: crossover junction endodeoxyribonuclease RuvC [Candidatus Pacebacteria bacterium]|nr:crossover junction endodeoxyribonuclease RuvC [Candidatus Paceibacterota bacterium]
MKVLAIDPGYGRCGMAIVERVGIKDILLFSVCVETDAKTAFPDRLNQVVTQCEALLSSYMPDHMALEKLFFKANRTTAMKVAEVRGALIHAASRASVPVHEYSPAEVKSAAAGWGGADKKQVAAMLHALVKIEKPIKHDDEYDAIAIGVTHLAYSRVPHREAA